MGLLNQGSTCYLNSLLQLLFHTGYFRSSVYQMGRQDTSTSSSSDLEKEKSTIAPALQELFFQMQERRTAPTTKGLTDAFGWDHNEVRVQHDIQEMAALLRDNLETKMKDSRCEGAINRLFEGRGVTVTQTLDRTYTSRRADTFYDIHLPLEKCTTIKESLTAMLTKDQLVGDNKYKLEVEGKPAEYKDAETGYQFTRLPPVIFFHLKRFEMDMLSPTLDMKKINTSLEFSETLDLREFETPMPTSGEGATGGGGDAEAAAPSTMDRAAQEADLHRAATDPDYFSPHSQAIYDLYGVIVHRGTVAAGHYYSYIRQYDAAAEQFTHWLEYDDETVRVVDASIAIDANFGGFKRQYYNGRDFMTPITHSAYILAYVRRADAPKILRPTPIDVIPDRVKDDLRRVMEVDEKRARIAAEAKTKAKLTIITDKTIKKAVAANTFELISSDERQGGANAIVLELKKKDPFRLVFDRLAEELLVSPDHIRLWRWSYLVPDRMAAFRPSYVLPVSASDATATAKTIEGVLGDFLQERGEGKAINFVLYAEVGKEYFPSNPPVALTPEEVASVTLSTLHAEDAAKEVGKLLENVPANPYCPRLAPDDLNPSVTLALATPRLVERVDFRSTAPRGGAHQPPMTCVYVVATFASREDLLANMCIAQQTTTPQHFPIGQQEIQQCTRFCVVLSSQAQAETPARFVRISRVLRYGMPMEMHISRVSVQCTTAIEAPVFGLPPLPPTEKAQILFIKLYDFRTASISYLGSIIPDRSNILGANRKQILQMVGLSGSKARDVKLVYYDETRPYNIVPLAEERDLTVLQVVSGNILTVQHAAPPPPIFAGGSTAPSPLQAAPLAYRFPRADLFYLHVEQRRFINIRSIDAPTHITGSMHMIATWGYDEVCDAIALRLGMPSDHLRLYANQHYYQPVPALEPMRSDQNKSLEEMLRIGQWPGIDLFYEELQCSRADLESLHRVKVAFCADLMGQRPLLLPETVVELPPRSTYQALVTELRRLAVAHLKEKEATAAAAARPVTPPPASATAAPPAASFAAGAAAAAAASAADALAEQQAAQAYALSTTSYAFIAIQDHIIVKLVEISMTAGAIAAPAAEKQFLDRLYDPSCSYEVRPLLSGPHAAALDPTVENRYLCCRGEYSHPSGAHYHGSPFWIHLGLDAAIADARTGLIAATKVNPETEMRNGVYDVMMVTAAPLHFPNWDDRVALYWRHTENRSRHAPSLMVNCKRPKEKPGSRYVAHNDPKLSLEKRKPVATAAVAPAAAV